MGQLVVYLCRESTKHLKEGEEMKKKTYWYYLHTETLHGYYSIIFQAYSGSITVNFTGYLNACCLL